MKLVARQCIFQILLLENLRLVALRVNLCCNALAILLYNTMSVRMKERKRGGSTCRNSRLTRPGYTHVTIYHARLSFATMLKLNGTSTELISESLGHSNLKTTVSYLECFDDEVKKQLQMKLMNF